MDCAPMVVGFPVTVQEAFPSVGEVKMSLYERLYQPLPESEDTDSNSVTTVAVFLLIFWYVLERRTPLIPSILLSDSNLLLSSGHCAR